MILCNFPWCTKPNDLKKIKYILFLKVYISTGRQKGTNMTIDLYGKSIIYQQSLSTFSALNK